MKQASPKPEVIVTSRESRVKADKKHVYQANPSGGMGDPAISKPSGQPLQLLGILAIGVLAMSSASILIRWAQAENVPSVVIAAYRLTIATLALSIPAIRLRAWQDYAKLRISEVGLLLLSGILLGLHFATWITSLAHTSVVSSVVLVTTTPLWIGLASPLVLRERAARVTWLGIAFAMAGGSIIGLTDSAGNTVSTAWGNVLALSGAVLMAGCLMIGRSVRARLRLIAYLWLVYGTAALLLITLAVGSGLPLTGYSAPAVGWMVALGLVPQLIGHTAANYAVRHLSATLVGVAILGEPAGSTVLAMLLLDEWPTLAQIVGGGLILAGIVLASVAEERRKVRQAQAKPIQ